MNGLNIDSYSSFPLSNISAGLLANMVADPIDVYILLLIFFLPFFGSTFQYPRGQVRGSIVFRFVALQAQPRNMKKGEEEEEKNNLLGGSPGKGGVCCWACPPTVQTKTKKYMYMHKLIRLKDDEDFEIRARRLFCVMNARAAIHRDMCASHVTAYISEFRNLTQLCQSAARSVFHHRATTSWLLFTLQYQLLRIYIYKYKYTFDSYNRAR